jgi:hypothetical protein
MRAFHNCVDQQPNKQLAAQPYVASACNTPPGLWCCTPERCASTGFCFTTDLSQLIGQGVDNACRTRHWLQLHSSERPCRLPAIAALARACLPSSTVALQTHIACASRHGPEDSRHLCCSPPMLFSDASITHSKDGALQSIYCVLPRSGKEWCTPSPRSCRMHSAKPSALISKFSSLAACWKSARDAQGPFTGESCNLYLETKHVHQYMLTQVVKVWQSHSFLTHQVIVHSGPLPCNAHATCGERC